MRLLAYIPSLLLIALAVQLIRLRAYKLFPWFFVYVCFGVLADASRFVVHSNPQAYWYVYWTTAVGYNLLSLIVLYEVYLAVFRNLKRMWWFPLIFPLILLVTCALLVMHTLKLPPRTANSWISAIITSELGVQLLQGLMFVVLVACVAVLGLRWRQYAFGISAGFGWYTMVALTVTTLFSNFVTKVSAAWGWAIVVAYSGSVLIWLWFFRKPQRPGLPGPNISMEQALQELEQYRELLRRMRRL